MEKYYKLDSGKIFKIDDEKMLFYSLDNNGVWISDPKMIDVFYDVASNYEEIKEENINKETIDLNNLNMITTMLESGTKIKYNKDFELYYYQDKEGKWINYPPLEDVIKEREGKSK